MRFTLCPLHAMGFAKRDKPRPIKSGRLSSCHVCTLSGDQSLQFFPMFNTTNEDCLMGSRCNSAENRRPEQKAREHASEHTPARSPRLAQDECTPGGDQHEQSEHERHQRRIRHGGRITSTADEREVRPASWLYTFRMSNFAARCLLLLLTALAMATSAPAQDALSPLTRLIPNDALAVIASPNLRAASDHLAQAIEAMDRGHLLMGSTPLEQVKAAIGFAVGVNDLGSAAIVLMPAVDAVEEDAAPGIVRPGAVVVIVPISDSATFFRGNFRAARQHEQHDEVQILNHAQFGMLHARSFGGHVALSHDAAALAHMTNAEKEQDSSRLLDQRSRAIAQRGHIFLWLRGDLQRTGRALPAPLTHLRPLIPDWRGFEHALLSVTFDALGFFVRSNVAVKPGSTWDAVFDRLRTEPQGTDEPPLQLPDEPFILVASLRGSTKPNEGQSEVVPAPFLAWLNLLDDINAVEVGWYLPDETQKDERARNAFAVVRGGQATSRRALVEHILKPAGERWSLAWERDVPVGENGIRADAFQLNRERRHFLDGIVDFHPGPRNGYVSDIADATLVTFGRSATTLAFASSSIRNSAQPMRQNHVVAAMRDWMPKGRFMEAYVDAGELAVHECEGFDEMPAFKRGAPPIGFGAAARDDGMESMLILPREVLAPVVDLAASSVLKRMRRSQSDEAGQP